MSSILDAPHFRDEAAAYEYVESYLWPTGPVCPHCGNCDQTRIHKLAGKSTRPGLRKCNECRKQFTVKVGTIFEDSHVPMTIWLQVIYLMCASKKGVSTRQIHRMLGERSSLKTAWFIGHRIRHAMAPAANAGPLGGPDVTVEADETFLSRSPKTRSNRALNAKSGEVVLSLVERGGDLRSVYLDDKNVRDHLVKHLDDRSRLVTDGSTVYMGQADQHESVDHSKYEWARGDVHTNTLEGFFSIFKRGLVGVYQHMDKKHLDRYLAEFDFRMNTRAKLGIDDAQRTAIAVEGFAGKRLQYKTAH